MNLLMERMLADLSLRYELYGMVIKPPTEICNRRESE